MTNSTKPSPFVQADRVVRAAMILFAWIHLQPAVKHLTLFARTPSIDEAWKGFGAVVACALYLQSPARVAAWLVALSRRAPALVWGVGWLLAVVHLVPAVDHVPKLIAQPSWGDGWRGVGSAFAVAWFAAPVSTQARVMGFVRRALAEASHASVEPHRTFVRQQ